MRFSDWKTTVAGLVLGAIPFEQTIAANLQSGAPIDWRACAFGFLIMALGVIASDPQKPITR